MGVTMGVTTGFPLMIVSISATGSNVNPSNRKRSTSLASIIADLPSFHISTLASVVTITLVSIGGSNRNPSVR